MKLDRRSVLGWTAVVAGAIGAGAGLRAYLGAGHDTPQAPPTPGYGKDPPLLEPAPGPWPRLLTARQKAWLAQHLDRLLPRSGTLPSAREAGLEEFFDEWLSAPYPDQRADRALILPLMEGKADPAAEDRLRVLALAAYYTTPAGIIAIGFVGNEPREKFDPLPADVTTHLERQFALLPEKSQ
jgi:hypothetical protein